MSRSGSATRRDVAQMAGVSEATVSLVMGRTPGARLKAATRARVLACAKALNYRPHHAASTLRSGRTHVLGFAVSSEQDIANPLCAWLLTGILEKISGLGYSISVHTTVAPSSGLAGKTYFLESARQAAADGFVILCSAVPDEELLELHSLGCPFVLIDRTLPNTDIPSICADFRLAGERLVGHLAGHGYDPIVVIPEPASFPKSTRFKVGCKAAAERIGCTLLGLELSIRPDPDSPRDQACVRQILDSVEGQRFGILSANEKWGVWAVTQCLSRRWDVPDRVGVAAVYDLLLAEASLGLTVWDFPVVEMGRLAARTLLGMLAGEEVAEETVISGQLVQRGSTRNLAKGGGR